MEKRRIPVSVCERREVRLKIMNHLHGDRAACPTLLVVLGGRYAMVSIAEGKIMVKMRHGIIF